MLDGLDAGGAGCWRGWILDGLDVLDGLNELNGLGELGRGLKASNKG